MNTYKEISKEEVLNLKEGDFVYYKRNNDNINYIEGIIRKHIPLFTFGIWRNFNNEDTNYSYADVCINELITDKRYKDYTFYIKASTYSATEVMQKIESGKLQDDNILIDKNGTEDSIYDVLEQDISALIEYAPYTIKERDIYIVTYCYDTDKDLWKTNKFTNKVKAIDYFNSINNRDVKRYFSKVEND
jgi:hypothetical protein